MPKLVLVLRNIALALDALTNINCVLVWLPNPENLIGQKPATNLHYYLMLQHAPDLAFEAAIESALEKQALLLW